MDNKRIKPDRYCDAAEAIPFGPMVDHDMTESDLFHLGPSVCLKFRGLKQSAANLKRATDAALSSYVATSELDDHLLDRPQVAFAFCYIASHFGLGLIDEATASEVLDHIAEHADALARRTDEKKKCQSGSQGSFSPGPHTT